MIPQVSESGQHASGFNSVLVRLEGGMRATLNWTQARQKARCSTEDGFKLLWEMDLGLCGKLHYPYDNAMQHQALALALEQFRDSLWAEFRSETIGLVLFRGSVDHSRHFHWDDKQRVQFKEGCEALYCTRVLVAYLQLLAARLPDELPVFALLDCGAVQDPLLLSQLVSRDFYDPIQLVLKGSPFADQALAWQEGQSQWGFIADKPLSTEPSDVKVGVLIPSVWGEYPTLRSCMEHFQKRGTPFRSIPEAILTREWDGLDKLYYLEEALTPAGKRMLQGFMAAGGIPINVNFGHVEPTGEIL